MSVDPVDYDVDENEFFHPEEIQVNIKNQVPFVKYTRKEFHEFKLIELTIEDGEPGIKEVASFIYPFWMGQRQFIYFSDDGQLMFERLVYERFLIYRRESLNDDQNPAKCRWVLEQRIANLPSEFLKNTQFPFFLSPDFQHYLDIDQVHDTFIIRETLS